jgi:hypothetical protein
MTESSTDGSAPTEGRSPAPPSMSIAEAIGLAGAMHVRAVLLHAAAERLVEDFAGHEPKFHALGILGVERPVPPQQLDALVSELRAAADAALAEALRVLGGLVHVETS